MEDNNLSINAFDDKDNNLKHVKVYNKLYELITNNTFPVGYQLPTEPELASKMEVSRVTLRRALSLLREDGLISNVRGKGNFVISPDEIDNSTQYTKKIQHPFYCCTTLSIDEVEIIFKIKPPSENMVKALKQDTAVVIVCERWFKKNKKAVGFSLTFLPIEMITQFKINLNEPKEVEVFIEETVYAHTIKSNTVMKYSTDGNIISSKYKISDNDSFIMLYEDLFSKENNLIMHTRYYIPTDNFKVHINLKDSYEF